MVPILRTLSNTIEMSESAGEGDRWRAVGQGDHVRLYSRADFIGALRSTGFIVRELTAESFGRHLFAKCGIAPTSVLYVVEKT